MNKGKLYNYLMYLIPLTGIILLFLAIYISVKNTIDRNKIQTKGILTIGYFDHVFSTSKSKFVNYNFIISGKEYHSVVLLGSLKSFNKGDRFWVLFLPSNPEISEILRDKNGQAVMFNDSSEIKLLKYKVYGKDP